MRSALAGNPAVIKAFRFANTYSSQSPWVALTDHTSIASFGAGIMLAFISEFTRWINPSTEPVKRIRAEPPPLHSEGWSRHMSLKPLGTGTDAPAATLLVEPHPKHKPATIKAAANLPARSEKRLLVVNKLHLRCRQEEQISSLRLWQRKEHDQDYPATTSVGVSKLLTLTGRPDGCPRASVR